MATKATGTFEKLMNFRTIIAEEIGCPSLATGEHPDFKYCCDEKGPERPCYCERAALRILKTLNLQELTHEEAKSVEAQICAARPLYPRHAPAGRDSVRTEIPIVLDVQTRGARSRAGEALTLLQALQRLAIRRNHKD